MASASTPLRAPRSRPSEEEAWDDLSPQDTDELRRLCEQAREEERVEKLLDADDARL